jgi:2-oxoglutarate dehydrogenase E2 component (dihydrolipoamide succinyltransferase)
MATKVLAPSLGEGVNELTVVKWLKQEGENVTELESLLEVETDKVVTEIPSPATGTLLKRVIPENEKAMVGTVIAWIGQAGENIPLPDALVSNEQGSGETNVAIPDKKVPADIAGEASPTSNYEGFISPVVAKIAREKKVDLTRVKGTGLGGRITKNDVMNFIETGGEHNAQEPISGDRLLPHNAIRKAIAEHMLLSKQTSPHVLTVMEADLSRVTAHRSANKEIFARDGVNLTYSAYFISAALSGLKIFPMVNSSWSEAGILLHSAFNVGMATSLGEEGLIVPVIKDADSLSLLGIARSVNDLAGRARAKKLHPEEVKGGTFTVTNHGIFGSLFAMPIINQPQCGILGVGVIKKRIVVVTDADGNDSIAIRPMAYLSFVFDHRILDGALADRFLSKVVESLENWGQ